MKTWSLQVRKCKSSNFNGNYPFTWQIKVRNWVGHVSYKDLDDYLQSENTVNKTTLLCITKGWFGWWATFQSQGW